MAVRHRRGAFRKRFTKAFLSSALGHHIASRLIGNYARFVMRTSRWTYLGYEEGRKEFLDAGRRTIVLLWHNRVGLMPFGWTFTQYPLTVLISGHRDGRLASGILEMAGVDCIQVPGLGRRVDKDGRSVSRTSTILEVMRHMARGRTISLVGDGPTGPRFVLKKSAIDLARMCDAEIILVTYSVKRRILLNSWDKFIVPLPFNRGIFRASTWAYDPRGLDAGAIESLRQKIESDLNAFNDETDAMLGHPPID